MKNTKNYNERQIIMKRIIALATTLVLILMFAGCGVDSTGGQSEAETKTTSTSASETADTTTAKNNDTDNSGKTLVAYFSATGTTKGVAELIANVEGADIYEITAAQPYTSDDLNYNDSNSRATKEQNDKTVRPKIGSKKANLDGYDTVFIGFPIWRGEEPRIMDTFVESYDFTGKTIIPFCTSGSSPIDTAAGNLKTNAKSGDWKDGRRFSAETSQADIKEWLNTI